MEVPILVVLLLLLRQAASQCNFGELACDGRCATPCDGYLDCADGSDETTELCSSVPCSTEAGSVSGLADLGDAFNSALASATANFKCNYGGCIPDSFTCNGRFDCWDKSDETTELCSKKTCSRRDFRCDYGACLSRILACNGRVNCYDGSDESDEACKTKRCFSSHFKCNYGACINKNKRCDGVSDCRDHSDEAKEICGASHTFEIRPPILPRPPQLITTPPPTTTTTRTTTTTTTGGGVGCGAPNMCLCPPPGDIFCVPCESMTTCQQLTQEEVCSTLPAAGTSDSGVSHNILECGSQPILNVPGIVRNHGAPDCGTTRGVPALTVVMANCWDTATLVLQCQGDGLWHPYGTSNTGLTPSTHLCQSQSINSPTCGRRGRYVWPPGRTVHYRPIQNRPQWPWLAGIFRSEVYSCTATVITPYYLLTAAHCVARSPETSKESLDVRDLRIQHFNSRGTVTSRGFVTQIHMYPGYKSGLRPSHDLAIIKLQDPIVFSHKVFPACVLSESLPVSKIAATFNRTTKTYKWELVTQQYDPRCYSPHDRCTSSLNIEADQFCAIDTEGKRYLPPGSSGGPYLVNMGNDANEKWTIAGIVSSSYSESSCTRPFTIFTSVADFWPWISACVNEGRCS